MDDKDKVGGQDRSRINTSDYEVQYWSEKLGCSAEEIRASAAEVGDTVEGVEEYLSNR
jgi:hypothetical protein